MVEKTIFSVPSRKVTQAAAAKEAAAKEAAQAPDDFRARQRQIDHDEAERLLADKYDLLKMWRADPANFPIEVAYWGILIEMVRPSLRFGGLLEKTPDVLRSEEWLARIGRVIAVGPACLQGKTESGIELQRLTASIDTPEQLLGKYVLQQPNTGTDVWFTPLPGKRLKIISNTEIMAVTTQPSMFLKP